ncbi:hypothetical protein PGT21_031814 [Puccinia graminis f. sp. tritici]|uniref:Uncharacterized protein n=2 Tax=Puccinia graminis f. sp. tritici TaxID=56615 RepID=A0A5B0S0Y1_PUCGR|nr:hypothetical protein PGT21_031814 [Puccinia graminis f. sp. tritici]KAA1131398.1 hypothetical protein PGTUg99_033630 [Puccinia graminis f. sp. tritici]KAA1132183.1 hypothetical protein PGTUg99_001070 [Puccinia graminis f. sp. tritici]
MADRSLGRPGSALGTIWNRESPLKMDLSRPASGAKPWYFNWRPRRHCVGQFSLRFRGAPGFLDSPRCAQRVELGATASYTVTSPRPRYELDDPGAMFPAMTLGRINHTPLGLSTPTRGRNRPTASGGPEGGGATEGSQGCLLEGVMVCGAGWGWHNVVFRAPSARVRVVYRRTSGTLICCGLSLGPPVLGEP